jgi:hypothetical protein
MAKRVHIVKDVIDTGFKQCNKKAYSKREAMGVAKATSRSGRVKAMKVYPCPEGNHWHVAHESNTEFLDRSDKLQLRYQ